MVKQSASRKDRQVTFPLSEVTKSTQAGVDYCRMDNTAHLQSYFNQAMRLPPPIYQPTAINVGQRVSSYGDGPYRDRTHVGSRGQSSHSPAEVIHGSDSASLPQSVEDDDLPCYKMDKCPRGTYKSYKSTILVVA